MSDASSASVHVDLLAARLREQTTTPTSTYRLQLVGGFGFDDARALVSYLDRLGVGACYLSPSLMSRPGSLHGYDAVDYQALDPELGGREAFVAFARSLRERGMGVVLDFVPNHMSVDPVQNRLWRDVLENGASALASDWFDIEWRPVTEALRDRVLLPILGDQYGLVLERGELKVAFEAGRPVVRYFEHQLPLDPRSVPLIFEPTLDDLRATVGAESSDLAELLSVLDALGNLPPHTERDAARRADRRRETEVAYGRLRALLDRAPEVAAYVARALEALNGTPGRRESFDALDALLERQPYRLAYWRSAFDEINYRRFFDINELAAVRMEEPRVFEEAHRLVLELVRDGLVTGLRLDHPDGLADPEAYFEQVQEAVWRERAAALVGAESPELVDALVAWRREARAGDAHHWAVRPMYVAAEKILSEGETFPPGWAIHGGTGYVFLNQVNGLLVDPAGLARLQRLWIRISHQTEPFAEIAYEGRRLIAQSAMASEINLLAHALQRLAARDRRTRDFTLNSLRRVLREIVASFPVYRTYVSARGISRTDRAIVARAVAEARRRSPVMEPSIFDFVGALLLGEGAPAADAGERLALAMRIQQLTGPVQAKGLEDTAFYRYSPLIGVNEVGSHPANPCLGPGEFHLANVQRRAEWPETMTTLSTHDTKRSGDARARLAVLSEEPAAWQRAVTGWMRLNARWRGELGAAHAPDRADEYHFYQALVAIWPPDAPAAAPAVAPEGLADRLAGYMVKAIREAKVRSSWLRPDQGYEDAVTAFVHAVLTGPGAAKFLPRFVPYVQRVAELGAVNALAQLALQLGSPGVPDIYQGNELWAHHLVDPDNRGRVDFARRQAVLDRLAPALEALDADAAAPADGLVRELRSRWPDGGIKLWALAAMLRYRRRRAGVFLEGEYLPLEVEPAGAPAVAFARRHGTAVVVVIVPRLAGRLVPEGGWPVAGAWGDARVVLPAPVAGTSWRQVMTGSRVQAADARLRLATVLDPLPIAWLERV